MDEHLHDELSQSNARVKVSTAFGEVIGGRAKNGTVIFLGMRQHGFRSPVCLLRSLYYLEIPYALPPRRFEDPQPLPSDYRYEHKEYIRETAC